MTLDDINVAKISRMKAQADSLSDSMRQTHARVNQAAAKARAAEAEVKRLNDSLPHEERFLPPRPSVIKQQLPAAERAVKEARVSLQAVEGERDRLSEVNTAHHEVLRGIKRALATHGIKLPVLETL